MSPTTTTTTTSTSSTSEKPSEPSILIPSLPNDVALNCLALVPRSHHPILSSVSKPVRSLLSSTHLYTTRSLLNSTQSSLYLCIRVPTESSLLFYTLYQTPNNPGKHIFVQVPSIPSPSTIGSAFAVVGPKIYVIGGSINDIGSQRLWILDCRFHTWQSGPKMHVGREFPAAGVIDDKIFVIGGCMVDTWAKSNYWAEVFNPRTGSWSPVASQQLEIREKWMHSSAVIEGKIYAMADRGGIKYDPKSRTWENVESEIDNGWRGRCCVLEGVLYCYDYVGKIRGIDVRNNGGSGEWKELKGVDKILPKFLCGATMVNLGGKLAVVWEGKDGGRKKMKMKIWCAKIEVKRCEDGELWGKVEWLDTVLSVPNGSSITHCIAVTL